jgi:hypothetical protein
MMRHFVRFAKVSPCGSVARSGWKLRLFASSREARAFAEQMIEAHWRVESGRVDEFAPGAPRPLTADRNPAAQFGQSARRDALNAR